MRAAGAVQGRRQLCAREHLPVLSSLPTHARTQEREGYRVFTAGVYSGGAWSCTTDHPIMVRAGRAALSALECTDVHTGKLPIHHPLTCTAPHQRQHRPG
jgi:hypothetical protein